MDIDWALSELKIFVEQTQPKNLSGDGVFSMQSHPIEPRLKVLAQWATVKKIFAIAYPEWESENLVDVHYEFGQRRDAAIQCISQLEREVEVAEKLGDPGPVLLGSQLHVWVWKPAAPLWTDGHYGAALQTAATSLNSHLQRKLERRDVSGRELINEAFSQKAPEPGKSRLQVKELENDELTKNAQEGIRNLAMAAISLVRNIQSHSLEPLTENEALEQMAILSHTARGIEACTVVK